MNLLKVNLLVVFFLVCMALIVKANPLPQVPRSAPKKGLIQNIKSVWNKTVDKTISKLDSHSDRHYWKHQGATEELQVIDKIKETMPRVYNARTRKLEVEHPEELKKAIKDEERYIKKTLYHKGHFKTSEKTSSAIRKMTGRPKRIF